MKEDDSEYREGAVAIEHRDDRDALGGALILAGIRKWRQLGVLAGCGTLALPEIRHALASLAALVLAPGDANRCPSTQRPRHRPPV